MEEEYEKTLDDIKFSQFKRLRAFPSKLLKILAFSISKNHFINFNNSFYNTPNIKGSIFLPFRLK